MNFKYSSLIAAAALFLSVPLARAQNALDPSGHWEGNVSAPGMELDLQIDFAKDATGALGGTISLPAEHVVGLPFIEAKVAGKTVSFMARRDQAFEGDLSDDGQWIVGRFFFEGYTPPFTLRRKGEARIEPPLKSPSIPKNLEGVWNGSLGSSALRVVLTMSNQADGFAIGQVVNLDEGDLRMPVTISQTPSGVTLDLKAVNGSYTATLDAEKGELVGTYRQGTESTPLIFRRVSTTGKQ